jgi:hypothetical protein
MLLTGRFLCHYGFSLCLLHGISHSFPLLHPPLDVVDHLLEEVLRLINRLSPEHPLVVNLLLDILPLQCLILISLLLHGSPLRCDFLQLVGPSAQEPVHLPPQGRRKEVNLDLREVLILHRIEVQVVQIRRDVIELVAAIILVVGLRTLATSSVVREEEGTEVISLVLESQILRLLLIQLDY